MASVHKISLLVRYLFDRDYRDYRYVRNLHIFDHDYFIKRCRALDYSTGELTDIGAEDPLWTYFKFSRAQLSVHPPSAGDWKPQPDPHPLFDTWYYVTRNHARIGRRHPFSHYLMEGWKQGLNPGPYFDQDFYRATSGWKEEDGDPLSHFVRSGRKSDQSLFFDVLFYLDSIAVSSDRLKNPVKHYLVHGIEAGKSPVPVFDIDYYRANTNLLSQQDPLSHYLSVGENSNIGPNERFAVEYYRKRYLDDKPEVSALAHYLETGVYNQNEINSEVEHLPDKPIISVIVPVFNPDLVFLRNCIRSVLYQSYPYWELCLVDDCSDDPSVRTAIASWAEKDRRISYHFNEQNEGISSTTRRGVELSSGSHVCFLDNDDELAPDCLYQLAKTLTETACEIIYSDEDLIGRDGHRFAVFHKPDFNQALLYSHNYVTHLVAVSKMVFTEVGAMGGGVDGAQDYDLMLRLAGSGRTIHHIRSVLYHWRAHESSTSVAHGDKPYAHSAGKRALHEFFKSKDIPVTVVDGPINFHYRPVVMATSSPSVSVLFCTGHDGAAASVSEQWLRGRTNYDNISYIPLEYSGCEEDNGPSAKAGRLQDILDQVTTDFVAILGNPVKDLNREWLTELVMNFALDDSIGITCGRVDYDGSDGPSLVVPDVRNPGGAYFTSFITSASKHANGLHNLQYVACCDWEVCVISLDVLQKLDGFNSADYADCLAMPDLCFRMSAALGKKVLYSPEAVVTYAEDHSSGADEKAARVEKQRFQEEHRSRLLELERYYNFGHVTDSGLSRDEFLGWLTGAGCQEA